MIKIKILIWFVVIVLFIYAMVQILRLVRHDIQDKKNQHKKMRANVTQRAREGARDALQEAEKTAKKRKMDFSAFRPPENTPDMLDATQDTPLATTNKADIDLLAVYDQVSTDFPEQAPAAAVAEDDLAPMPLFDASEELLQISDDDPYAVQSHSAELSPDRSAGDADTAWDEDDLQDSDALLLEDVVVQSEPREADELLLFSGDGAPPQTIWSRRPSAQSDAVQAESTADVEAAADESATASSPETVEKNAESDETNKQEDDAFSLELELRQFRRELARIRGEMAEHRDQVEVMRSAQGEQVAKNDALQNEMKQMREQMQTLLNGQGISPEYKEAIVLARSGMGVEELAQRCSMSISEAQLVCSLATGGSEKSGETV